MAKAFYKHTSHQTPTFIHSFTTKQYRLRYATTTT